MIALQKSPWYIYVIIVCAIFWHESGLAQTSQTTTASGKCAVAINASGHAIVIVTNNCNDNSIEFAKTVQLLLDKTLQLEKKDRQHDLHDGRHSKNIKELQDGVNAQALLIKQLQNDQASRDIQLQKQAQELAAAVRTVDQLAARSNASIEDKQAAEFMARGDVTRAAELLGREARLRQDQAANLYLQQGTLLRAQSTHLALEALENALTIDPNNYNILWEAGDLATLTGNSTLALSYYQRMRDIAQMHIRADPGNAKWQRNLRKSYNQIGSIYRTQGNVEGALQNYKTGMEIAQKLVETETNNTRWQHDLMLSHFEIASILGDLGNLDGGLNNMNAGLEIAQKFIIAEISNAQWKPNLCTSNTPIYNTAGIQVGLGDAFQTFQADMAIARKHAMEDFDNVKWQRDIAVSHEKIGHVLSTHGNLDAALGQYEIGLAIRQKLSIAYPNNIEWQRDLCTSHAYIAGIIFIGNMRNALLRAQEDGLDGVLKNIQFDKTVPHFQAYLTIAQQLAAMEPNNTKWQRDLALGHNTLGDLLREINSFDDALKQYEAGIAIIQKLIAADPSNTQWQRDLALIHMNTGKVLSEQGKQSGALKYNESGMVIAQTLAAVDPSNTQRQRDLAISYDQIGNTLREQGNLDGALKRYQASLAIAQKLAAIDTNNTQWQRDIELSHNRVGKVLYTQGNLDEALKHYQASLAIAQKLAVIDTNNTQWQRDVELSHDRVGKVLYTQGNLDEALKHYQASLAIAQKLAAIDTGNTQWQRDVERSHEQIGEALHMQGNLDEALKHYQATLTIAQKLAAIDTSNTQWQRDVERNHAQIGDAFRTQGNLDEALKHYQASLAIAQKLVALNPDNNEWQRDVELCHDRVGKVLYTQGNLDEALKHYQASLAIAQKLVALDPDNSEWQRDVELCHEQIGDALHIQGNLDGAFKHYQASLAIAQKLAAIDTSNTQWQRDLKIRKGRIDVISGRVLVEIMSGTLTKNSIYRSDLTEEKSNQVQLTPRELAAKQLVGDTLVGNACKRKLEIEVNIAEVFLNNPNQSMDPPFLIRGSVKANPSSNQAIVTPLIGAIDRSDGVINLTVPSTSNLRTSSLLISLFRDAKGEGWEGMMEGLDGDECDDVRLISKNGNKTIAFPVMTDGIALKMSNPALAPKSAMYRLYWLQIAEARGSIDATYYLGEEYEQRGKISPQNYARALQYYHAATKKNDDARAQSALGRMYEEGLGTQANTKTAEKWKGLAKTTEEAAAKACVSPKVRDAVERYMRRAKSSANNMGLLTEAIMGINVDLGEITIRKITAKDVISINKPFLCEIGGERVNGSVEKQESNFVTATDQYGRVYHYDNTVGQVTSALASGIVTNMIKDMPYNYTFRLKPMGNGHFTLEYGVDSEVLDLGYYR